MELAAGAAAPWNGTCGDKRRPDASGWIIRAGSSSKSHRILDTIIQGQVAGRRPGLDHPGQNKKERPQPPGLDQPENVACRPGQDCPRQIKQKGLLWLRTAAAQRARESQSQSQSHCSL